MAKAFCSCATRGTTLRGPAATNLTVSSNATADRGPSTSDCAPETKRRKVSHTTYLMWKHDDLDCDCSTMSWLDCETHIGTRKKVVTKLLCSIFKTFKERNDHRRNFSEWWIVGANSVRMSNIRDHLRAD